MGGKSYLTVVLIFTSLMFNDAEYLLTPLLVTFLLTMSVYVSCLHLIPSCIVDLPIMISFFQPEGPPSAFPLEGYCWWQTLVHFVSGNVFTFALICER